MPPLSQHDETWVRALRSFVLSQLDNPLLSVPRIAQHLNLSERQLYRKVKRVLKTTPNKYIRDLRLEVAYHLLAQGTYVTVNEVAHAVGYSRTDYFSNLYHQNFGIKPIDILKEIRV